MATLYRRGKWFYAQFEIAGKRRQFTRRCSDRMAARHLLTRLERAAEARRWNLLSDSLDAFLNPQRTPSTLTDQVAKFLDSRILLSPRTIATYELVLLLFLKEGANIERFLSKRTGATQ